MTKPKIQKSKNFNTFRATSQFLDFLVFLGFFWFFGFRLNETMVFFGFPAEIKKKQGFFWFFTRNPAEKPKKPCVFLVFQQKSKKTQGFFGFSPETQQKNKKNLVFFWFSNRNPKKHKVSLGRNPKNQKNPRKTKKSKSFGPFTKALDFWIFGFLVSVVVSHGLSKCFLLLSTGKLILKRT